MKWLIEFKNLVWTLVGTGLCLITLSGETQKWGVWITALGLTGFVLSAIVSNENDPKEE